MKSAGLAKVLLIALGGIAAAVLCYSAFSSYSPRLEVVEESLQMPKLFAGEHVRHVVKLKNVGRKPLDIEVYSTSCGCTSASIEDPVILGRSETELIIDLAVPNEAGPWAAEVIVQTNEKGNGQILIRVSGTILQPIFFSSDILQFGRLRIEALPAELNVHVTRDVDVLGQESILEWSTSLPYFEVLTSETLNGVDLVVFLSDAAPIGAIRDSLRIRWTENYETRTPIMADVYGPVHLSPRSIFFDGVKENETRTLTTTISPAFEPIELKPMDSSDMLRDALETTYSLDTGPNSVTVTLTLDGKKLKGNARSHFVMTLYDTKGVQRSVYIPIITTQWKP